MCSVWEEGFVQLTSTVLSKYMYRPTKMPHDGEEEMFLKKNQDAIRKGKWILCWYKLTNSHKYSILQGLLLTFQTSHILNLEKPFCCRVTKAVANTFFWLYLRFSAEAPNDQAPPKRFQERPHGVLSVLRTGSPLQGLCLCIWKGNLGFLVSKFWFCTCMLREYWYQKQTFCHW